MWNGRGRWALLLEGAGLVAALASCDPPPPERLSDFTPPFVGTVHRSQFFEYHTRDATPLCPTLLSLMDQNAQLIGSKIGFTLAPGDPLIPYYQFNSTDDLQASGVCPTDAPACTSLFAVYSGVPFHAHEMAHAYTFRAWHAYTVGLLEEGEAVALSCQPACWDPFAPWPPLVDVPYLTDWRPLLHLSGDNLSALGQPGVEYIAAGVFVTWLASHFGWPAVGQLHQRVAYVATADEFEQAFEAIFSTSVDAAWAAAQGAPDAAACQPDWQCAGPPLSLGESAVVDCDLQFHGTLRVGKPPVALLMFTQLVNALSCTSPGSEYLLPGYRESMTLHWATLPPGNYAFVRTATETVVGQSVLPLFQSQLAALLSERCATAPTFPLSDTFAGETYIDFPPLSPSPIDGWLHLTGGDANHTLDAYAFTGGSIIICDGCDETAACSPLAPAVQGNQFTTIGDNAYVHLAGVTTKNDQLGPSALDYFVTR